MKPNEYERGVLALIFVIGGLYAFTDYGAPKSNGTFIGGGLAMLLLSLVIGWLLSLLVGLIISKAKRDKLKVRPAIILALVLSIAALIDGLTEYNPFF